MFFRSFCLSMSLDKSIKSGKEHRKPYYGKKAVWMNSVCFKYGCSCGSQWDKYVRRKEDLSKNELRDYESGKSY